MRSSRLPSSRRSITTSHHHYPRVNHPLQVFLTIKHYASRIAFETEPPRHVFLGVHQNPLLCALAHPRFSAPQSTYPPPPTATFNRYTPLLADRFSKTELVCTPCYSLRSSLAESEVLSSSNPFPFDSVSTRATRSSPASKSKCSRDTDAKGKGKAKESSYKSTGRTSKRYVHDRSDSLFVTIKMNIHFLMTPYRFS